VKVVETFAEGRSLAKGSIGLVPTLGYLHEGHLDLMSQARAGNDQVMTSLFVNPLQFDEVADFDAYPRQFDRDARLMKRAGVDILFAPSVEEMYPIEPVTRVVVDVVTDSMEGAHRPGHFAGVATVVTKLLAGLQPDRAYFGKKDAQQLAMVIRLTVDLSLPVEIVPCSTVRESDGLALSSRNVRIPAGDRDQAARVSRGLFAAADLAASGETDGQLLEWAVSEHLMGLDVEYVTLADRETARPLATLDRPAFLATAVRIGGVRLIDNVWLEPDGTSDRGTLLRSKSTLYEGAN